MIKTKTIATIGPASRDPAILKQILDVGVDALRLNFSHGTLEDHALVLQTARRLAEERDLPLAIMGDLSGPKIRTGKIDLQHNRMEIGNRLVIQRTECLGSSQRLSTTYPKIVEEVRVGERVLIDDGTIELRVVARQSDELICECVRGGTLFDRKGINLPDSRLAVSALTDKDVTDLQWAIRNRLEYVALSFVRHPDDIRELRRHIESAGGDQEIVAKIEKPQAIEHLDDIIAVSDAVLVARGDLGVEMSLTAVPVLQKDIVVRCRSAGKPVIIATQILQSMMESAVPTRAEVSDAANAILDTADALMLTGETAMGKYPVEAAAVLQQIAQETEQYQTRLATTFEPWIEEEHARVDSSLAAGAKLLARHLNPPLVVVATRDGKTARLLSKHRFEQPILALTDNPRTRDKLSLNYGVIPMLISPPTDGPALLATMNRLILERNWAKCGDSILVVTGSNLPTQSGRNTIVVHRIT